MTVTITRPIRAVPVDDSTDARRVRMSLLNESGSVRVDIPFAPREIEYNGLAADWATVERPGSVPLLLRSQQPLDTLAFSVMLVEPRDRHWPQTAAYNSLVTLARQSERVLVRYGPSEAGLWRITDLGVGSTQRHPQTNEMTRAVVSLTLTRASDPAAAVGPVSGGAKPPAPAPPAPQRVHVVVKGDCLWNIAKKFYGNGSLWPRIFDANRGQIKNPDLIYPGQRFVIP